MCSILYSVMVLNLMKIFCTTNAETSLKVEQSRGCHLLVAVSDKKDGVL